MKSGNWVRARYMLDTAFHLQRHRLVFAARAEIWRRQALFSGLLPLEAAPGRAMERLIGPLSQVTPGRC